MWADPLIPVDVHADWRMLVEKGVPKIAAALLVIADRVEAIRQDAHWDPQGCEADDEGLEL